MIRAEPWMSSLPIIEQPDYVLMGYDLGVPEPRRPFYKGLRGRSVAHTREWRHYRRYCRWMRKRERDMDKAIVAEILVERADQEAAQAAFQKLREAFERGELVVPDVDQDGFFSPDGEWIPYCSVPGCEFGVCTWGSYDKCHRHESEAVGDAEMERRYDLTHERSLAQIKIEDAEEERTGVEGPWNLMLRSWRDIDGRR